MACKVMGYLKADGHSLGTTETLLGPAEIPMVIRLFDHVEVTGDSMEATEKLPGW